MKWAKTNTKRFGVASFLGVLFLSVVAFMAVFQPFASAAYLGDRPLEYGYFYNQYVGGRTWHDVIPGGLPNTADKNTFINFITDKYYNGTQQEKTGAAFIINLQLGNPGSGSNRGLAASDINGWAVRIQQPQVSFSMENYAFTYNSAYDTPTDDDLFYYEPDVRWALVVRYNGVVVSVIKQDCANPLDGNSGIPQYTPSWSLSATANASTPSIFPGQSVNFSYNLRNNGPDPASFQYVTRVQEYINGVPQAINPVSRANGDGSWPVPNATQSNLPGGASVSSYSVRTYTALYNPSLTRVCSWIEYAGRSSTNGTPAASNQACVNVTQPLPNCVPLSIVPSSIEPGVAFTVGASVTYQSQAAANAAYQSGGRVYATVTGPGYSQSQTYAGPPPAAADLSRVFSFPAPTNVGTYTVTYGVNGGTVGEKDCSDSLVVAFSPYFRAQGGNVLAGAGFGTGCTTAPAKITSWNKHVGGATPYYGAGTDLAAVALGQITGFVSSNNQNGTTSIATQSPAGLTFANTGAGVPSNIPAGIYGGAYGVTNWCMPDYAATAAADPTATSSGSINSIGINTLTAGDYIFTLTGSQNLGAPIMVPAGVHVTIVITGGDLTLNSNISYAAYTSLTQIPRLQIFVKGGDINVRKGVTSLSGVYAAQKSAAGVGGKVDTCAEASWTYANCNSTLTFYGAVSADQILLKRMSGTSGDPATAAEYFVFGPEAWLGSNFTAPDTAWQSATSLSPVL